MPTRVIGIIPGANVTEWAVVEASKNGQLLDWGVIPREATQNDDIANALYMAGIAGIVAGRNYCSVVAISVSDHNSYTCEDRRLAEQLEEFFVAGAIIGSLRERLGGRIGWFTTAQRNASGWGDRWTTAIFKWRCPNTPPNSGCWEAIKLAFWYHDTQMTYLDRG